MRKYNFIIVDDSALDCFIAEKMIKHTGKCEELRSFTSAADALNYINETASQQDDANTIIILDVLMPMMSGFEFMEAFEDLPALTQQKYQVVALTSSLNKNDMEKISSYKAVKNLLDKPITTDAIRPYLV